MAGQQLQRLSQRIWNAAEAFLKDPAECEALQATDDPRGALKTGAEIPNLRFAVADLQEDRKESFLAIFQKHLEGGGQLGRAEYLFMAYEINRSAYCGSRISRKRFIELLQVQRELFRLFHSRFSDERYLLTNLNAYALHTGINNNFSAALEKLLDMAEKAPEARSFSPDLITRNLAALLRESEKIGEVAFSSTLSSYDETFITLAASGIFHEGHGSPERFQRYLEQPVSLMEEGTRYRLHVTSNGSGFWGNLELNNIVMPLDYRQFCELCSLGGLERQAPPATDCSLMLRLPHGYRLVLSPEEADSLKVACSRIRIDPGYRAHDRIWSVLYGVAN